MRQYWVYGSTAATAATAANAACGIWNPSTAWRIRLLEMRLFTQTAPAAGSRWAYRRTSARGTATATTTATADNDTEDNTAPISGFLLDTTYSAQPTFQGTSPAGVLGGGLLAAVAGSGVILPERTGIVIPASSGLAVVTLAAVAIPASDVAFLIQED